MIIAFGIVGLFCASVIVVLLRDKAREQTFSDYAVGGRAFGPWYQTMSFLNTWWPGGVFISTVGMAVSQGLIASYSVIYSLLSVIVMYVISGRIWTWASRYGLATQADFIRLRYGSDRLCIIISAIGFISAFPWLILGFRTLAYVVSACSYGALGMTSSVAAGAAILLARQYWTIRLGMHGVVVSDMLQGIVAYIGGTVLAVSLILWLLHSGGSMSTSPVPSELLRLPRLQASSGALYLWSLIFSGAIGGWCWPAIFVRLYTADSLHSIKKSAVFGAPISLLFGLGLCALGILAARIGAVRAHPDQAWFILADEFGGPVAVGCAAAIVLAATMGSVDGGIQAMGAQIANDLIRPFRADRSPPSIATTQYAMFAVTTLAAGIACLPLPQLFSLAILAYQGVIQIAAPLYFGIFWSRGNTTGALSGITAGFIISVILELYYPASAVPWAGGLTTGVVALIVNVAIYVSVSLLRPNSLQESKRIAHLLSLDGARSRELV